MTESTTQHRYTAAMADSIEHRWQERWSQDGAFEAPNPTGPLSDGTPAVDLPEKSFIMDMFPYPSGSGLHVGHPLGYIATDVVARHHRMLGRNVLYTMGYDAFGLPAEQYAVQTGTHPRTTTEANIANMRRQPHRLGLSHDPRRSFATTDPEFVRWTQWIFLRLFDSWYDPQAPNADGVTGRARPVSELREEARRDRGPLRPGRPPERDPARRVGRTHGGRRPRPRAMPSWRSWPRASAWPTSPRPP